MLFPAATGWLVGVEESSLVGTGSGNSGLRTGAEVQTGWTVVPRGPDGDSIPATRSETYDSSRAAKLATYLQRLRFEGLAVTELA